MPTYADPLTVTVDSRLTDDYLDVQPLTATGTPSILTLDDNTVHLFAILAVGGASHLPADTAGVFGNTVTPLPNGDSATELVVASRGSRLNAFYVVDGRVTWAASDDGGQTWNHKDLDQPATNLTFPTNDPDTLFAVTPDGDLVMFGYHDGWRSQVSENTRGAFAQCDGLLVVADPTTGDLDGTWIVAAACGGRALLWQTGASETQAPPSPVTLADGEAPLTANFLTDGAVACAVFLFSRSVLTVVDDPHDATALAVSSGAFGWDADSALPFFVAGCADIGDDNALRLYGIEASGTLWTTKGVWNEGVPEWSLPCALDVDITALSSNAGDADGAMLAVTGVDGSIEVLEMPASGAWVRRQVQALGTVTANVSTYRTLLKVTDANGAPCSGVTVTITPSELVALEVDGTFMTASQSAPLTLTCDGAGHVVISQPATDLRSVALSATAPGAQAITFSPHAYLHANLSGADPNAAIFTGSATVPPLSATSIAAVASAGTSDDVLAGASSAINQAFTIAATSGAAGFTFQASGPTSLLASPADVSAGVAVLRAGSVGSAFGDLGHGLWHALKRGAAKIVHIVVDAVNKVAHAVVEFVNGLQATIDGIAADLANDVDALVGVVHGIFSAIGAEARKVVDWLKDLFDWGAIWATMKTLAAYADHALERVKEGLDRLKPVADHFITDNKDKLDDWFTHTIAKLDSSTKVVRSTAPAPGSEAQRHWMTHKVLSSSRNSPGSFDGVADTSASDVRSSFFAAVPTTVTDGTSGVYGATTTQLSSHVSTHDSIAALLASDLLTALKAIVDTSLTGLDDLVRVAVGASEDVVATFEKTFDSTLDLPLISWLWDHVLRPTGDTTPLTLMNVAALLAAFPATIGYKLTHGNQAPPLPEISPAGSAARLSSPIATADGSHLDRVDIVIESVNFWTGFQMMCFDIWIDMLTAAEATDPAVGASKEPGIVGLLDAGVNFISAALTLAGDDLSPDDETDPNTRSLTLIGDLTYFAPILMDALEGACALGSDAAGVEDASIPIQCAFGLLVIVANLPPAILSWTQDTDHSAGEDLSNLVDVLDSIVGPLPWVTQFLLSAAMLAASDDATLSAQVIIDVVADMDWVDMVDLIS